MPFKMLLEMHIGPILTKVGLIQLRDAYKTSHNYRLINFG